MIAHLNADYLSVFVCPHCHLHLFARIASRDTLTVRRDFVQLYGRCSRRMALDPDWPVPRSQSLYGPAALFVHVMTEKGGKFEKTAKEGDALHVMLTK